MNSIISSYPDIVSAAIIPMVIAIFALGFPLLIQTISRIDDKYDSTKLIETFRKDWISRWFLWTLVSAVLSYVVWLFQFPPLENCGWFINNSALILFAVSVILLIVMTFLIVYLTYVLGFVNPSHVFIPWLSFRRTAVAPNPERSTICAVV